jgi:TRAP-type C4-dicarboxylate transport system substrate-binding protein
MPDELSKTLTRRSFLASSAAAASATFLIPRFARAGDAEITLKLATVAPPATPWARHIKRLKKRVKEESEGRVRIKSYLGGAMGDEIHTASLVRAGNAQIWFGDIGALAKLDPELGAFNLPYLFPSHAKADDIIDNHLVDDVASRLNAVGFELLFFSEYGYRSIGTNFGFVKSTHDLKGKSLRSRPTDVHTNTLRKLGATPEQLGESLVMKGFETDSIEGFDASPRFTLGSYWYTAITHVTTTRHSYAPMVAIMNSDAWSQLPANVRKNVFGNRAGEANRGRKWVRARPQALRAKFAKAGISIHESTTSELDIFKQATEITHEMFTTKHGSTLYSAITKHL